MEAITENRKEYVLLFPLMQSLLCNTIRHYRVSLGTNCRVSYLSPYQSSVEVKEHCFSDLDNVTAIANGLTIVMGDFSATLGECARCSWSPW